MELRHTHFDVKDAADTLKKVASDSEATALASIVFPLPGGPKRRRPEETYVNVGSTKTVNEIKFPKISRSSALTHCKLQRKGELVRR